VDVGQAIYISSRLILGAVAAFLAILLWAKNRDISWMFLVIGTVAAYIEIVYSILDTYGFFTIRLLIGSVPLFVIVLSTLKIFCFIAAFFTMITKRRRR